MRFFVKMNGNFTSTLRLAIAETNFEFVTCGTNVLQIAFLACNQIYDIFGFTIKDLCNGIRPTSTGASKAIGFLEIIVT